MEEQVNLQTLELQAKAETEAGAGYTEKVSNYLTERFEAVQEGAPNEMARSAAAKSFRAMATRALIGAEHHENTEKAKAHTINFAVRAAEYAKFQTDFPSEATFRDQLKTMKEESDRLSPSVWTPQQADASFKKAANQGTIAFFTGLARSTNLRDPDLGLAILQQEGATTLKRFEGVEISPEEALKAGFISQEEAAKLNSEDKGYMMKAEDPTLGMIVENPDMKLSDFLSPQEKLSLEKELLRASRTKMSDRSKNWREQQRDQVVADRTGIESDPLVREAHVQEGLAINADNPTAQARILNEDDLSQVVNSAVRSMRSLPNNQWPGLLANLKKETKASTNRLAEKYPDLASILKSPQFGADNAKKIENVIQQKRAVLLAEQKKQAANYVLAGDPALQKLHDQHSVGGAGFSKLITAVSSKQAQLRIPRNQRRLLTDQMRAAIVKGTGRGNSASTISSAMARNQAMTGRHFRRAIAEAGIDDVLMLMTYNDSEEVRQTYAENYKNAKAIKDAEKTSQDFKTKQKEVFTHLERLTRDARAAFANADHGGGLLKLMNGIDANSRLEVSRLITQGNLTSAEEVAKAALQKTVPLAFARSDNGVVMHPFKGESGAVIDTATVIGTMDYFSTPQGLKELPISMDEKVQISILAGIKEAMKEEFEVAVGTGQRVRIQKGLKQKEAFFNELSKRARWFNDSPDTMKLMYLNNNGTVLTVLDKEGDPITMDFDEITNRTHPSVTNHMKGFLQKAWEAIF
jgi:hypothetical protein